MAPLNYLLALLLLLAAACVAEVVNLRSSPSPQSRALIKRVDPQHKYPTGRKPDLTQELELLDIVLVASVDGKFHAINRTSAHTLWSMSSFLTTTSVSAPSTLSPLVRTQHADFDPDEVDDMDPQEMYIIEPQSGDIYVMTSPNGPLQRFPFSMPELVDMSPFTSPGDEEGRVFIGRKETSLVLMELETGRIKATLNSECPSYHPEEEKEVDLDELEDNVQISSPTEIFIGRTDYYISIYSQSAHRSPGAPRQNLSFSTYGPNNKDNLLQASYRKTKDDVYIQSLPNGEIISFKAQSNGEHIQSQPLWKHNFNSPIVAVFDVLQGSTPFQHHPHTFVLLQPRPRLRDVIPNLGQNVRLPNIDSAYVGMVEETKSLFVMTPGHYPLVVFGGSDRNSGGRLIEAPKGGHSRNDEIDDINRPSAHRVKCEEDPADRRCLVGLHKLDEGDGHESRMRRLLDGPKSSSDYATLRPGQGQWLDHGVDVVGNIDPPMPNGSNVILPSAMGDSWSNRWEAAAVTLVFGFLSVWFLFRRIKHKAELKMGGDLTRTDIIIPSPVIEEFEEVVTAVPKATPKQRTFTGFQDAVKEPGTPAVDDGDESDRDGEGDGEVPATPGKRKGRRGKRGRKKKVINLGDEEEKKSNGSSANGSPVVVETSNGVGNGDADLARHSPAISSSPLQSSLVITPSPKPASTAPSLVVSDTILGFGSHGTVVFQGSLQGRAVAVKRLLQDFVTLASREVNILQESDDHPNVIRYYYQEAHANFLYIALELCPASLADIIEYPDREQFRDIAISFDPKKALKQITSGLRHLHALKLVHRDIKPQNILVSSAKNSSGGRPTYRMLISDFGLCKKLDIDQTSFLPTANGAMAAGTVGWRAPEILRGEVKLDDVSDDHSMSSRGSVATVNGSSSTPTGKPTRLTKSVDIFALGCLFYYTLTNGGHPYGDRFEREVNILKNSKNLEALDRFGEEGTEACDLINDMLHPEAYERPDTTSCLLHPFFWDPGRRLNFLQDASDRFEIMCRDPKDPNLLILEKDAALVVGNDWHSRLDKVFIENLGKFRKYDGRSVQDLLRALRNKKHHYQDLPDNVKRHLGPMPEGFLAYFTRRYPRLFLHVHGVIKDTPLRTESMFRTYFELPE